MADLEVDDDILVRRASGGDGDALEQLLDVGVNSANPCRCAKKTRGFMEAGYVDATSLLFARARMAQVRDVVPATARAVATLDEQCARIYREHPFYEPPDIARALRRLIDSSEFRRAVDLS